MPPKAASRMNTRAGKATAEAPETVLDRPSFKAQAKKPNTSYGRNLQALLEGQNARESSHTQPSSEPTPSPDFREPVDDNVTQIRRLDSILAEVKNVQERLCVVETLREKADVTEKLASRIEIAVGTIKNVTRDINLHSESAANDVSAIVQTVDGIEEVTNGLDEKIENLEETAGDIQEKADDIQERTGDIQERTEDIQEKTDDIQDRVNGIEDTVNRIETTVDGIDTAQDTTTAQITDLILHVSQQVECIGHRLDAQDARMKDYQYVTGVSIEKLGVKLRNIEALLQDRLPYWPQHSASLGRR